MVHDEKLINKWSYVLQHQSENWHEIVVKVIYKFELDWFNLSPDFFLDLHQSPCFLFYPFYLLLLRLLLPFPPTLHLSRSILLDLA